MTIRYINKEIVKVYDTDFQQVAHYAAYYRFFTDAVTNFSKEIFGDSTETLAYRGVWFVVVESSAKYMKSAKLGDELDVEVTAELLSKKVIKYSFEIRRKGELLTTGYLVMVCVDPEKWKATEIPQDLIVKFKKYEKSIT